jgi:hypothetical protein
LQLLSNLTRPRNFERMAVTWRSCLGAEEDHETTRDPNRYYTRADRSPSRLASPVRRSAGVARRATATKEAEDSEWICANSSRQFDVTSGS